MMGYGYGMGAGGWIAMALFWIGVIVLVVWLIVRAFPASRHDDAVGSGQTSLAQGETPEQLLDRRFAAGEVDVAAYDSMRATLRSNRSGT
ncbi:hypothetical protein [Demequina aurantiaca]|uniref:hypothetical protein n=1 Tax=Demequina aurantiaca TaxID=676200 RepID=UPI003D357497